MSKIQRLKQQQLQAIESGIAADVTDHSAQHAAPLRKVQAIKARELETGTQYAARDTRETGTTQDKPAAPHSLAHYQAAMDADLAHLAQLNDVVEKAKAKQTMLAAYWPFVQAYIDNGDNYPNDIAVRVCIWLFDTLDIERGLDLAFVLIKQNQITPPKFDRDLMTFVCDAMYDIANALLKADQSASPYLDALVAVMDSEQWSLAPPVQSKLYVMLAKHKKRVGEWATCLALCEKAEQVNPEGAGVKGLIKEAKEKLKPVE